AVPAAAHLGRGVGSALAHEISGHAGQGAGPALAHVEPARRRAAAEGSVAEVRAAAAARAAAARGRGAREWAREDLVGIVHDAVAVVVAVVAGFRDRRAPRAPARDVVVDDAVAVVVDAVADLGHGRARAGVADGVRGPAADLAQGGVAADLARVAPAHLDAGALAGAQADRAGRALVVALVDHAVAVVVDVVAVLDLDRALHDLRERELDVGARARRKGGHRAARSRNRVERLLGGAAGHAGRAQGEADDVGFHVDGHGAAGRALDVGRAQRLRGRGRGAAAGFLSVGDEDDRVGPAGHEAVGEWHPGQLVFQILLGRGQAARQRGRADAGQLVAVGRKAVVHPGDEL